jgi:hypothetical protein
MELLHYRNDDWVVLCQVCYFFANRISKMATTWQLIGPYENLIEKPFSFNQLEHIIGPGSHVGFPICTKIIDQV